VLRLALFTMRVSSLIFIGSVSAFSIQQPLSTRLSSVLSRSTPTVISMAPSNDSQVNKVVEASNHGLQQSFSSVASAVTTTSMLWAASAQSALADSPDWGLFEGRIGSLLHPIMMFSMLGFSIWTAILGFNWRRQRTMGDEISALKKSLPDLQGSKTVLEALAAAKSADAVDQGRVNKLQAAMSVESQIDALQKERKELAAANPRDQHFSQGSLLALVGTVFAIEVSTL
jgi:hypothetical protein